MTLKARMAAHQTSMSHADRDSSLFMHVSGELTPHIILFGDLAILDRAPHKSELCFREAWHIHNSTSVMNIEKTLHLYRALIMANLCLSRLLILKLLVQL